MNRNAPIRIEVCIVVHTRSGWNSRTSDSESRCLRSCRWRWRSSHTGLSSTPFMMNSTRNAGRMPIHSITRQPMSVPCVDQRIAELEDERREQEPHRVAALHHARRGAAQVRRPVLERQRHAGRPDAAHADAEQRADREQHPVRRREAAEEREQRVPEDREHQRALAAPAIGRRAGADAAGDAEDQRDRAERARERLVDGEAALNVDEQKRQDGEVEAVEHPAEVGADERLPLRRGDLAIPGASGRAVPRRGTRGPSVRDDTFVAGC